MTPHLSSILAPLDRFTVERERDRLREELADYEALLRLIDRHGAGSDMPPVAADPALSNGNNGNNGNSNGHSRKSLSQKRDAVLSIMGERPGRWTTAEVREALTARGIDPQTGTPVKNILWQLAKAGAVSAAGSGVYEYPPLSADPDDPRVQEAMGL